MVNKQYGMAENWYPYVDINLRDCNICRELGMQLSPRPSNRRNMGDLLFSFIPDDPRTKTLADEAEAAHAKLRIDVSGCHLNC
jgi:hypothetical protein